MVTSESVTLPFHVVGSAVPSSQVRNCRVDPTRRARSHCFDVETACPPATEANVVPTALDILRIETLVLVEVNSRP